MFKLESYITPILLSYVDKYIKNFRPEDSQVSLWGGDVSFHNLDLRLEVLEEELQLPFSFVSGHIHELLIHVPWTKLASEPITITINTIECILKLKGDPSCSDVSPCTSGGITTSNIANATKEKKRNSKKQEMEAPPGYVQSLVNKIVGNICINCNNLILKYVEEDIVVSMNIKLLTVESANQLWQPAFAELSPTQVLIRKLITLTDLTVCLDRRNAAGKIDVYQEPMLYRCSLEIRLMRKYFSATAKRTSTTRIDIHCNSMEFSMTTQQVPMLMRLINLIITLHSKELRKEKAVISANDSEVTEDGSGDDPPVMGWAGWAWSLVPSILPTWDEEWAADQQAANIGHTIHLGIYVDNAVFSFKVSESSNEKTYYAPRKLKYWPILSLRLGGVFMDNVAHGIGWVNCQAGIARASLLPAGDCTCGAEEVVDNTQPQEYFKSTLNDVESCYWNDSLQDPDSPENNGQRRMYNVSWDMHLANITEDYLMARSPAFAIDYLYQLEVPEDYQSDNLSELGSDLEYSNLTEKVLLRVVVGPFTLKYSAGLMHRIEMLHQAAQLYDYMPYVIPKRPPTFAELPPPSSEDFDALNECIPFKTIQFIAVRPALEIVLWDHAQSKHKKKTQSLSALGQLSSNSLTKSLPKLRVEIEYVDAKIKLPIYPNRLVYTTCKLPNPPKNMLDSCYTMTDIKCRGLKANLIIKDKSTTVLIPSHINYAGRQILKEQYWLDKDICLSQHSLSAESIAIAGTKSKLMVIWYIIDSILNPNLEQPSPIFSTTLMFDAYRDTAMEYLELNIEDINFTSLKTVCTHTIQSTLGTCKAFIIEPDIKQDKEKTGKNTGLGYILISGMSESVKMKMNESPKFFQPQQVMILSGPEPELRGAQTAVNSTYLLSVTVQVPLNPGVPDHPALFLFKLADFRISIDPMLCRWLQYKPRAVIQRSDRMNLDPSVQKRRRVSEASGGSLETPRRTGPQPTSVHSSSERDLVAHNRSIPLRTLSPSPERSIHEDTNYFKFLLNWYSTWRCLLVHGDINHITIYLPTIPIPALGAQDLQGAFLNNINLNTDLEIVIIKLPSISIRSAGQRQNLSPYMICYPIKLPDSIWTDSKKSFPWNISVTDFSCYTIHSNKKYFFIKPVSCNATIAVTTKSYGVNVSTTHSPETNIKSSKSENLSDRSSEVPNKSSSDFPIRIPSLIQLSSTLSSSNKEVPCHTDLISSMGVCVHVDTMPFLICMSEEQVALISSITIGLLEVSSLIFPKYETSSTPVQVKRSVSPPTPPEILFRESTKESSISGASKSVEDVDSNDTPKLTLFVQWTLTRFSIALYGNEGQTHLKLLLDMEDIVNSLDIQNIYFKLKAKIATASIRHFKRNDNNKSWTVGPYLGLVMRGRESSSLVSEENCFASITFTRARCMNVHSRWGQTKKTKLNKKAPPLNRSSVRYLSELMITLQSVDFVLSPKTLSSFILVLNPLRCLAVRNPSAPAQNSSSSSDSNLQSISTAILPLIYLDVRGLRIILPSAKKLNCKINQDVYIMQVDHVILTPSADNPICRVPLRPDMYQQAAQAGLLNIPGSEMEDRQYQLTASSLSASTSSWVQLEHCLSLESSAFNLRTMNENPALEWNNLDSKTTSLSSHLTIIPVVSKFDLCVVAAPAMVHGSTVICGHAMEINCVSDVDVSLSTTQLILAQALGLECGRILDPIIAENSKKKNVRVIYPYSKQPSQMPLTEEELLLNEFRLESSTCSSSHIDSGVDLCDIGSDNVTIKASPMSAAYSKHTIPETTDYNAFTKKFAEKQKRNFCDVDTFVPLELLFTGGTITFGLYQVCYATETSKTQINSSVITLETGYEASEEGSLNEELHPETVTVPFLQLQVCQPNTLVSRNAYDSRFQFSVFDIKFSISHPDSSLNKLVPTSTDYNVVIIETKPGLAHQVTGIPPAFATIRWSTGVGKSETVDVNISRPVKIYVSVEKWRQINDILKRIWCCIKSDSMLHKKTTSSPSAYSQSANATYTKFAYIKSKLFGVGHFNLNITQTVLNFKIDDNHQADIAFAKIKTRLTITHRPERIQTILNFDSLTVSLLNKNIPRMLLNPWSFDFYINLFWENWQQRDADPLIHINVDSDCFELNIGPDHINILEKFHYEFNKLIDEIKYTKYSEQSLNEEPNPSVSLKSVPSDSKAQYQDQHYKDDLRAGAFQFVDATVGEEIPLPYQVLFWAGIPGTGSMAWRYPQPRALTRVHIYPVPFQINSDDPSNQTVHCQLEYFSEVHGSFLPYIQFELSECNMLRLNMPNEIPDLAVSSIWRVLLSSSHLEPTTQYHRKQAKAEFHAKHNIDFGLLVSPRALAACMRIDSFFSASLVPNVKTVINLSSIQINLHNHINLEDGFTLPAPIATCHIDGILPPDQAFLFFSLDSTKIHLCMWKNESILVDVNTNIKCNVVDYGFLTVQNLIEPFAAKLTLSTSDTVNVSFIAKPIVVKFGPSIAHTIAVSDQVWRNAFHIKNDNKNKLELTIISRYVIHNNTNLTLRFGQAATDENLPLLQNCCTFYVWRSQKRKQLLRVGIEELDLIWSNTFQIEELGNQFLTFERDENITIIAKIESLSATQKLITFSGSLLIVNMLTERFEMKVFPLNMGKKDNYLSKTSTHIVVGHSNSPTLVSNCKIDLGIRLRFQGLDSSWSGDIPLKDNPRTSQPWLVKVPLQERGQFLGVWCRIITQGIDLQYPRILVILWPLYMIRSHLPMPAKVQIDTPSLDVHLQTIIEGRGITKQLYCPGTIDHSHQLTFQIETDLPASNPYVPLNYSLVDQKQFFKKQNCDIDEVAKILQENQLYKSKWPFVGDELRAVDWVAMDQPQTNVTVRYQPSCEHSSSLLLELLPWCLVLNDIGIPVAMHSHHIELCQVPHHGVVTPPKLEDTFILRVFLDNNWHCSQPLQLSGPDKTNSFYMPKITGLIPLEGHILTTIQCCGTICNMAITSEICSDIRIVRVCASHVICNSTNQELSIICYTQRVGATRVPKQLPTNFKMIVPSFMDKSMTGLPITQWIILCPNLDKSPLASNDYAFFIAVSCESSGISIPVRVDGDPTRRCVSVPCDGYSMPVLIITQHYKGQIYITIESDPNPQLLIVNQTPTKLLCAQSNPLHLAEGDLPTPVIECPEINVFTEIPIMGSTYYTMPDIYKSFPDISNNQIDLGLTIAISSYQDIFWCQPISISKKNEICVPLPNFNDIKITVTPNCYTTTVIIQIVSEVEISAREIRSRLSGGEYSNEIRNMVMKTTETTELFCATKVPTELDTLLRSQSLEMLSNSENLEHPVTVRNLSLPRLLSTIMETSHPSLRKLVLPTLSESSITTSGLNNPKRDHFSEESSETSSFEIQNEFSQQLEVPSQSFLNSLTVGVFLKSLSIILMTDLDGCGMDKTELAAFTLDDVAVTVDPSADQIDMLVTMSDLQIDNQLFNRGEYDFPVVLLGQKSEIIRQEGPFSLNVPLSTLLQKSRSDNLLAVNVSFEVYDNLNINSLGVKDINIRLAPISIFIEDNYFTVILNYLDKFSPTNLILPCNICKMKHLHSSSDCVCVPEHVLLYSKVLAKPLKVSKFIFEPLEILLSVHSSIRMYIALDQSPLYFGTFEKQNLLTTPFKLGHALAMHYLSGAIFGAGWVVGSLEILGSPSGLARSVGTGIRDFVQMPYQGLLQGPWGFLVGFTHGSASLITHITAGTVNSLSKMAASIARNLDRLTLDSDHFQRTEELRRLRPQGLSQGLMHGLTGLGISILGALGGIAHHPLNANSPRGMVTGMGLGLVGAIAKPISGAAELLALTGQGILHGTGWHVLPQARSIPIVQQIFCFNNAHLKYPWKILPPLLGTMDLLYATEATCITMTGSYEAVALLLTKQALVIIGLEEDVSQRIMSLAELQGAPDSGDPTLVCFRIVQPETPRVQSSELDIQMDPTSRARVAQYIHHSNTLNQALNNLSESQSDTSLSPLQTPSTYSDDNSIKHSKITFYINPQSRNHFLSIFSLAKKQYQGHGFALF